MSKSVPDVFRDCVCLCTWAIGLFQRAQIPSDQINHSGLRETKGKMRLQQSVLDKLSRSSKVTQRPVLRCISPKICIFYTCAHCLALFLQVKGELKMENQRLKDENGALIRVITKLSK